MRAATNRPAQLDRDFPILVIYSNGMWGPSHCDSLYRYFLFSIYYRDIVARAVGDHQ